MSNNNPIQKQELTSMNIAEEQLRKLKEPFPEAFTEGLKVDWDKLRLTLGQSIDVGKERYGMNWPGKADCFKTIQQPSIATLIPVREESVDFDSTENLFIEGDNLEVLKLLQKSYLGKVKMIYIDPPYNTGKEFIYPDNFTENLETYLEYTGQVDSNGKKFGTNTETDGRFHSKWLNMMYPRLFLAKNLLREDGLIFISIDDNEVHNLRLLMNEIFGEENFITNLIWEKRYGRSNDAKLMSTVTEHLLLFRKNENLKVLREPRSEKTNEDYSNPDNDPRGKWTSVSFVSQRTRDERPNLGYSITNPHTGKSFSHPSNSWKYNEEKFLDMLADNRFYWGKNNDQDFPRIKRFLSELAEGMVPVNLWKHSETGTTDEGTKEVLELIGKNIFTFPKPTRLIQRMVKMTTSEDDIILDFFAGSGSTAHAIFDLNKSDISNRKFICVQLPELCEEKGEAFKAGYKTIADVSKAQILNASAKIKNEIKVEIKNFESQIKKLQGKLPTAETKEEIEYLKGKIEQLNNQDLGFKVFKLSKSNFKIWDNTLEKEPEVIQAKLFEHIQHISPEAEQESILFELLLKSGFDLTTPIEKLTLAGKRVFSIAEGQLLICLEKELTHDCIKAMAEMQPTRVICLDEGFKGENAYALKTNAVQIMKSKGVVNFRTI